MLGVFAGSRAGDGRDYATAMQTFDTALFQGVVQTAHGIGNAGLKREGLLERIRAVQEANGIKPSKSLVSYYGDEGERQCPHFSIEMEKIKFGRRHFEALSESPGDVVDFKDCVSLQDALSSLA